MKITWLGQAGLLFETEGMKLMVIRTCRTAWKKESPIIGAECRWTKAF